MPKSKQTNINFIINSYTQHSNNVGSYFLIYIYIFFNEHLTFAWFILKIKLKRILKIITYLKFYIYI